MVSLGRTAYTFVNTDNYVDTRMTDLEGIGKHEIDVHWQRFFAFDIILGGM
jgi:hypothetical protein